MLEIKGKENTAICFAKIIEDEAVEQIRRMCDYEFTRDSKIRIMPDVHSGKGCTIGTTMTIKDKVVPNVVGVDIGCGMYTVNLGKIDLDLVKIDEVVHLIPSGHNVWEGRKEPFDLTNLVCNRYLKDSRRLQRSLGTLGGGNHFIEIDQSQDGTKYLVIHSGSRNLGKQVAEYYQDLAIDLSKGKEEYFIKKEKLIKEYKEAGRRNEIQNALKSIEWTPKESTTPEDLCFVYGNYLDDYDWENIDEWAIASGMLDNQKAKDPETGIVEKHYYDTFKQVGNTYVIHNYNAGNIPTPFKLYLKCTDNLLITNTHTENGITKMQSLYLKKDTVNSDILIDTSRSVALQLFPKTQIVIDSSTQTTTSKIYDYTEFNNEGNQVVLNNLVSDGRFFKLPVGYNELFVQGAEPLAVELVQKNVPLNYNGNPFQFYHRYI